MEYSSFLHCKQIGPKASQDEVKEKDYSGVPNKRAARLFNCEKFFHPSHSY